MLDYLGTTVVLELWEETLPYSLFWGSCVFQLFVLRVVDVVPSQLTAQWLQLFPVAAGVSSASCASVAYQGCPLKAPSVCLLAMPMTRCLWSRMQHRIWAEVTRSFLDDCWALSVFYWNMGSLSQLGREHCPRSR